MLQIERSKHGVIDDLELAKYIVEMNTDLALGRGDFLGDRTVRQPATNRSGYLALAGTAGKFRSTFVTFTEEF